MNGWLKLSTMTKVHLASNKDEEKKLQDAKD